MQAGGVGRRPNVPPELKRRPFTLGEARASGLSKRALQGKAWQRIGSELYCWKGLRPNHWQTLAAWRRRLPPDAAFAGLSSAWLHRLDVDPCNPVEVLVAENSGLRSRNGLLVHRGDMSDVTIVRGLPATTIQRTFRDLRRRLPEVDLLVLADEALRRGLGRFHELAERAESPMETRLRWVLIQARLQRPQVQAELPPGRADLYFPTARLVIEFDGGNHRDRLVDDDRRQNAFIDAGFRMLRYTAADVYQKPELIVTQVRKALRA
jgi:very-short-patch-repair endonuclease